MGAVCQWGRLSCKDPAGTTRCVVFTGRLRTFKKNTKMQGLSRLGVLAQSQPCDLGVSPCWSTFSHGLKRSANVSFLGLSCATENPMS